MAASRGLEGAPIETRVGIRQDTFSGYASTQAVKVPGITRACDSKKHISYYSSLIPSFVEMWRSLAACVWCGACGASLSGGLLLLRGLTVLGTDLGLTSAVKRCFMPLAFRWSSLSCFGCHLMEEDRIHRLDGYIYPSRRSLVLCGGARIDSLAPQPVIAKIISVVERTFQKAMRLRVLRYWGSSTVPSMD